MCLVAIFILTQGDMIARKISAIKRSHSGILDVTLSTIGGNMTIDLLVADEVVVTEKAALKYLGVEDFGAKKGFFAKVRGAWTLLVGERK
jgi:hypothetical protein